MNYGLSFKLRIPCVIVLMRCCLQEYTSYHFDVIPSQLRGALDRFAQFFIEPLCKADALEREVQAVNSEFVGRQAIFAETSSRLPALTSRCSMCGSG